MKTKIFSKGRGWYIPASNYKDKEDRCFIDLYFPKNSDPEYKDNGRGFSCIDVDIEEGKFSCYKGKAGLTVFKYREITEPQQQIKIQQSNNGADINLNPADYPFY